ncbi:hypothetical protein BG57_25560 [Caballeronia grimmiae]|uniref:Uncharacterized protein n=1 Tax=Caballeronia grimmiae TaxID=1071679 RepID=A0A069P7Y6_9BURK|nr:hypothetical protein BG57_25560 [Caballeronia grimmiae]
MIGWRPGRACDGVRRPPNRRCSASWGAHSEPARRIDPDDDTSARRHRQKRPRLAADAADCSLARRFVIDTLKPSINQNDGV